MSERRGEREELSAAEWRLVRLLALLQAEATDRPELTTAVLRRARWQLFVRDALRLVAELAAAAAQGLEVLARGRSRAGRERE